MRLTEASLKNPAAVAVIVALVSFFGLLALFDLPLQLFPDIARPQMTVQAGWRAASPQEMEAEIVEPIESVLEGVAGLEQMDANVNAGNAWINLTFAVGTDMEATLVEVLARLNRLPPLPRDADPPRVELGSDDATQSLNHVLVQKLPGHPADINDFRPLFEERIAPRVTVLPGVAGSDINGAEPAAPAIEVDLDPAAVYGVTLPQVAAVAGRATDIS